MIIYRNAALFSSGLLVISLILFLMVDSEISQGGTAEAVEERRLYQGAVSTIAAVALVRDDMRFGLIHQADAITIEPEQAGEPLSQDELRAFLFSLSRFSYLEQIHSTAEESRLGFRSPRAAITIFTTEGEKERFILGRQHPMGAGAYVLRESDETTYLISDTVSELFLVSPQDFRDRRILSDLTLDNLDQIDEIRITNDRGSITLQKSGAYRFRLIEPIENTTSYEKVLDELIMPLLRLPVAERLFFVEINSSLDTAGRLEITAGEQEYVLDFFSTEAGLNYVRTGESSDLFRLSGEALNPEAFRYSDFLAGMIYHANISEILNVEIEDHEERREYTLDISGVSVDLNGRLNGILLEREDLLELSSALFGFAPQSVLADSESTQDPAGPLLTMRIQRDDGGIDIIDFRGYSGNDLLVSVNAKTNFSTSRRSFMAIREALENKESQR